MREFYSSHIFPKGQSIQITQGDITLEDVDAIVNAANEYLLHGGGVAGAISRRGGPQIQEASNAWISKHGPVANAEPAITTGGKLKAKYIIHAVGPRWGEGEEEKKLSDAVIGSLQAAEKLKLHSMAMPAISTGIFGFPVIEAAKIILESIMRYFQENPDSGLRIVRLVLYDQMTRDIFINVLAGKKS